MTDNVEAEIPRLMAQAVTCDPIADQGYGPVTALTLPGGGTLGLYRTRRPMAHG